MIESMCVVCHGPIDLQGSRRRGAPSLYCRGDGGNCRAVAYRMRAGHELPPKYAFLRVTQAHRRELLAFEARVVALVVAGCRREVG